MEPDHANTLYNYGVLQDSVRKDFPAAGRAGPPTQYPVHTPAQPPATGPGLAGSSTTTTTA